MAVFQRMDVNTLKLRNLIFKNPDESLIPANYQLLSKGDGNTVWAPSVDVTKFNTLNEQVNNLLNTDTIYEKIYKPALSTATQHFNLDKHASTLVNKLLSSDSIIFNDTTLKNRVLNPMMPKINELFSNQEEQIKSYLDEKIKNVHQLAAMNSCESMDRITQTTNETLLKISESTHNYFVSSDAQIYFNTNINAYLQTPQTIDLIQKQTQNYLQSSDSKIDAIFNSFLESEQSQTQLTNSVTKYFNTEDSKDKLDVSINDYFRSSDSIKPIEKALNNIFSSDAIMETLFKADNINTAFKTALNEIISSDSILENVIQSEFVTESLITSIENILSSDSIMNAMAIYTDTTLANYSTNQGLFLNPLLLFSPEAQIITNTDISNNLTVLNTFSTNQTSTNNFFIDNFSTMTQTGLTSKLYQTFIELEAYSVAIIESTIKNVNSQFTVIISSQISAYTSTTQNLGALNYAETLQANVYSTIQYIYPSTLSTLTALQSSLYSTVNTNISTLLLKQYANPITLNVNSLYNLSTLTNSYSYTRLSTVTASIIDLDLRSADNFQVKLSDLGNNVYYGLTYTTDSTVNNRNITLELDLLSSYSNKFTTLDTENLTGWLSKPSIINSNNTPNLNISSFIGKYIVDMRFLNNRLHIKNVYPYPYIYSNITLTQSSITIAQNVTPSSNPNSYTYVYAGTQFNLPWATNDPNVPVGVKFIGVDSNNNTMSVFSGPYTSGLSSALVNIPSKIAYVLYDTIQLVVYPQSGNVYNTNKIFDTRQLIPKLAVINPNANITVRIYNPGTINTFLGINDISIYSNEGINLTRPNSLVSIILDSSIPFQNDPNGWGPQNAVDGIPINEFRAGFDLSAGPDTDAFFELRMLENLNTAPTIISSVVITSGQVSNYQLTGMKLLINNTYSSTLSVSSITTLTNSTIQTVKFS